MGIDADGWLFGAVIVGPAVFAFGFGVARMKGSGPAIGAVAACAVIFGLALLAPQDPT